jgi:hypothetical protein
VWSTADKTLENKKGKKDTLAATKPDIPMPTLKFKVNAPAVIPATPVDKASQRRTSTSVLSHDPPKSEVQQPKNPRRKRDAPDAIDDELLGLTEDLPKPVIAPPEPEPKPKKVKLAFKPPVTPSASMEKPPANKNGGRAIHALPSKPITSVVSSSAPINTGSPAIPQPSERKIKLSTSQRPSAVATTTYTPPVPAPSAVSTPLTASSGLSTDPTALVSDQWRELPGLQLPIRKLRVQKYLQDITKEPIFAPVSGCFVLAGLSC